MFSGQSICCICLMVWVWIFRANVKLGTVGASVILIHPGRRWEGQTRDGLGHTAIGRLCSIKVEGLITRLLSIHFHVHTCTHVHTHTTHSHTCTHTHAHTYSHIHSHVYYTCTHTLHCATCALLNMWPLADHSHSARGTLENLTFLSWRIINGSSARAGTFCPPPPPGWDF